MSTPIIALRLARWVAAPPVAAWLRLDVEAAERLPGAGPLLLAPNHRSIIDHFVLAAASPRPLRFLGKAELSAGLGGFVHRALGMVPVDRGAADREALATVAALLDGGEAVAVFPEGTRSPTGELFRFRSGLARLAAVTGAAVVPVGLVGTAQVWPRGASRPVRRPDAGVVRVRFGVPLAAPAPDGASRRAFTDELWARVAELCDQPRADRFAPAGSEVGAAPGDSSRENGASR